MGMVFLMDNVSSIPTTYKCDSYLIIIILVTVVVALS